MSRRPKKSRAKAQPGEAVEQFELFPEAAEAAAEGRGLSVDLDGFEGPLHVLLALARSERVDLMEISIGALAEQYLAFIEAAREERLELAADYLVMAAWLAYLKSRLLLPRIEDDAEDELPPDEVARRLAFRLRRLEAMRAAGARLLDRNLDGRDTFARGAPEAAPKRASVWDVDIYDLLKAYGARRSASAKRSYNMKPPNVYTIEQARHRLEDMLEATQGWRRLDDFAPDPKSFAADRTPSRASRLASLFSASLDLTKDAKAELRQDAPFSAVYVRRGRKPAEAQ